MPQLTIHRHHNGKPRTRNGLGNVHITVGGLPKEWPATVHQRQFRYRGKNYIKFVRDKRTGFRPANRMKKGKDRGKLRFADTIPMADTGRCTSEMVHDHRDFSIIVEITGSSVPGMI